MSNILNLVNIGIINYLIMIKCLIINFLLVKKVIKVNYNRNYIFLGIFYLFLKFR